MKSGILALIAILISQCSEAQTAHELIATLTPGDLAAAMGLFSCGVSEPPEIATVKSLLKLGESAIPELEAAISALDLPGNDAPGAEWLLKAFALIKSQAALPKLRAMTLDPRLKHLRPAMDQIVSVLLDFTSSVTSRHGTPGIIQMEGRPVRPCGSGNPEPRDALDQLVFDWLSGSDDSFFDRLGPNAREVIKPFRELSWADIHARLGPGVSREEVSISYRFDGTGEWSAPRPLLEIAKPDEDAELNPKLSTTFKDRFDHDCGRVVVEFDETGIGANKSIYRVDNSNMIELLQVISNCASR